jgi:DNA replicative helicase MCM subunit Mcm2 (Cdc46/Mcm family)
MSNKTSIEHYCERCGGEFMVTYDQDNNIDEPIFCVFCAERLSEDELEFDED